jgi:hypothetical protein
MVMCTDDCAPLIAVRSAEALSLGSTMIEMPVEAAPPAEPPAEPPA